ncbi:MAG: hypothetical protein P8P65_07670 [Planktotalea sp.]|uniref:hypothetical protein n=1 Tax=Planktotalea sp. TaxID=2029877 RepID=UPI0012EA705C|nr:hypothetical protein [Planktotalea sp.]MDG1076514.1 hypothetical protein [Planktotalea sp.]
MSLRGAAYQIDQREIERVLRNLMSRQSLGFGITAAKQFPTATHKTTFEGWQRGQLEFASRIAQISAKHAVRHKAKFCWKHHSIRLLRRLELVVMVATALAVQYM